MPSRDKPTNGGEGSLTFFFCCLTEKTTVKLGLKFDTLEPLGPQNTDITP